MTPTVVSHTQPGPRPAAAMSPGAVCVQARPPCVGRACFSSHPVGLCHVCMVCLPGLTGNIRNTSTSALQVRPQVLAGAA